MVVFFRVKKHLLLLCAALIILVIVYFSDEDSLDLGWLIQPGEAPEAHLIKCYNDPQLSSLDDGSVRKNKSIFFFETSCHHNGTFLLNSRQACAVESAALVNPDKDVLVLVPSPFDKISTQSHMTALLSYPNVRIEHIDMSKYFIGTPLENWYKQGRLKTSRWPTSHTSDILRYTTLWKFGGYYVDLDVVILKSFNGLTNFVGAEDEEDVAAGFLAFNYGHPLIHLAMLDLKYKFKGWRWGNNGPGVITRALKRYCRVQEVSKMTKQRCGGVEVMPPSAFYAIPWRSWMYFFATKQSDVDWVMKTVNQSIAIHVWNFHSASKNATVGSNQPYILLASRFCPKVYATQRTIF
uniref:Lactosylceramide 4-alpha-galactosyltransferase n=1 Tax=Lygus hesperus TaxID=30085 RepID=A0A146MF39_LYGHE